MTTFIGFNTINQYKKFTLVDFDLIKRDLSNAFNIRQGQLPGRPGVGTIIWDFVFENQDQVTQQKILEEVQRVVAQDPRISLTSANVYPQLNGILIELEVQIVPSTDAQRLSVFFNEQQRVASYV